MSEGNPETQSRPVYLRKPWLVAAIAVVAVVVVVLALFSRGSKPSSQAGRPVPEPGASRLGSRDGSQPQPGEMVITLDAERLANAQIKTEPASAPENLETPATAMRTTGTVQSNAYKEVPVLSIAGGIVREVTAQIGDRVGRGQRLATIFSSELAEAQAAYLKMKAEIERHHQHYRRTVELVELGASSREELETATAEYKVEQANLASMKQRLELLGMNAKQIEALGTPEQMKPLIAVESPASGIALSRSVNTGEVVMEGRELFRVVDLSSVWVIGQLYERDFAAVRVGTPAVVTTQAYPGRTFNGRVSYIDPRVEPQSRTAQVRVELANPGEVLRLGMFVDITFAGAVVARSGRPPTSVVPGSAIQMIGDRRVVFVSADQPGVFIQREVEAGPESEGRVPIYSGLNSGELVVTEGSFLLRSESLKIDPSQATISSTTPTGESERARQSEDHKEHSASIQSATVALTEDGYKPVTLRLRKGVPARVTFVRRVEVTCGTELQIPDYQIKRELPLNEPVVVEFTPTKRGESEFSCGMKMLRGKLVVR